MAFVGLVLFFSETLTKIDRKNERFGFVGPADWEYYEHYVLLYLRKEPWYKYVLRSVFNGCSQTFLMNSVLAPGR